METSLDRPPIVCAESAGERGRKNSLANAGIGTRYNDARGHASFRISSARASNKSATIALIDVRRQRDAEARGALGDGQRTYRPDIKTSALQRGSKSHSCLIGTDDYRKNMRTRGLDVATTAKLASRELNQTREPIPAPGIGSREFEGHTCDRGDQRRRGGRENGRARLTRKSRIVRGARIKPPTVPSALPQVCSVMTLSRPSKAAASPLP
jgi:hypothetical protein